MTNFVTALPTAATCLFLGTEWNVFSKISLKHPQIVPSK